MCNLLVAALESLPGPKQLLTQLFSTGIVCLQHAANLLNSFASFKNYTKEDVMKMTILELFLVLFPFDYLKDIVILKLTNK